MIPEESPEAGPIRPAAPPAAPASPGPGRAAGRRPQRSGRADSEVVDRSLVLASAGAPLLSLLACCRLAACSRSEAVARVRRGDGRAGLRRHPGRGLHRGHQRPHPQHHQRLVLPRDRGAHLLRT